MHTNIQEPVWGASSYKTQLSFFLSTLGEVKAYWNNSKQTDGLTDTSKLTNSALDYLLSSGGWRVEKWKQSDESFLRVTNFECQRAWRPLTRAGGGGGIRRQSWHESLPAWECLAILPSACHLGCLLSSSSWLHAPFPLTGDTIRKTAKRDKRSTNPNQIVIKQKKMAFVWWS